jgi:hypothetical protein
VTATPGSLKPAGRGGAGGNGNGHLR